MVVVLTPGVKTKDTVLAWAVTAGGKPIPAPGGGTPKVMGGGIEAFILGGYGDSCGAALVWGLVVLMVFEAGGVEYELLNPIDLGMLLGGGPSFSNGEWLMAP